MKKTNSILFKNILTRDQLKKVNADSGHVHQSHCINAVCVINHNYRVCCFDNACY